MTVTVYRSTDASAPTLSGTVGSLLSVLDACLVNGYGSQAAAGWTKPFANSANVGCYKNSAVSGTGMCLSVNDAAPGAGAAREARMTGFQTLSSVSAGTGQFPTSAQLPIGTGSVVCRKSTTADATARVWTLVADNTVFYLFAESGDYTSSPFAVLTFIFGDIFSYASSDPYSCAIIGRIAEGAVSSSYYEGTAALNINAAGGFLAQTLSGHFLAASWTGVGGSIPFGKHIDYGKTGVSGAFASLSGTGSFSVAFTSFCGVGYSLIASAYAPGSSSLTYPNPPDGGLYLSPIWIHHTGSLRGYFKGLWSPVQSLPLGHNQTYNGTGVMAGKSFLSMTLLAHGTSSTTAQGEIHVETSSTWS